MLVYALLSDHEELSDLDDLHCDDDDDLLLPDGSDVLHAPSSPVVSCHTGTRATNITSYLFMGFTSVFL